MSESQDPLRAPALYWRQLEQLKAASICIRLHRNRLGHTVRVIEIVKAVASSGAIGAWAFWRDWPFVWSGIIVASQVLDAVKHVFPFAKDHKAASDLTAALELLCIDAEVEWADIYAGRVGAEDIIARRRKLQRLQLRAERKHFPEGFVPNQRLMDLADDEADTYLTLTFGEGTNHV